MKGKGWVKGSKSNGSGGNNCVEARSLTDEPTGAHGVAVRNSKYPHAGTLYFTDAEWTAFVESAKAGEFDL